MVLRQDLEVATVEQSVTAAFIGKKVKHATAFPVLFHVRINVFFDLYSMFHNFMTLVDSWNQWSTWTRCSRYCNVGYRNRTRTCNTENIGSSCNEKETETCNTEFCEGDVV